MRSVTSPIEGVLAVAERLASAGELSEVLDFVARTTAEALGAEGVAILIRHDHDLVLVSSCGPLSYRRGAKDPELPMLLGREWDVVATAPMHDVLDTIGLVWVGRRSGGAFSPEATASLGALADVTALGIAKLRALEQLRRERDRGSDSRGPISRRCDGAPAFSAPATSAPRDPHCVLVVDDSERVLLQARLALQGTMTVLTATSGPAAIAKYVTARPAVVLIDLSMPKMNGLETLSELRKHGCSAAIALALRGDALQHARARKAGYLGVVEKPFRDGELMAAVMAAVASADTFELQYRAEDGGYARLTVPSSSPRGLTKLLPTIERQLRDLAEDCTDCLVVDVREVKEVNAEHVTVLARIRSEAQMRGITTVICATEPTVAKLRQIVELRDVRYVDDPEAAKPSSQAMPAAG